MASPGRRAPVIDEDEEETEEVFTTVTTTTTTNTKTTGGLPVKTVERVERNEKFGTQGTQGEKSQTMTPVTPARGLPAGAVSSKPQTPAPQTRTVIDSKGQTPVTQTRTVIDDKLKSPTPQSRIVQSEISKSTIINTNQTPKMQTPSVNERETRSKTMAASTSKSLVSAAPIPAGSRLVWTDPLLIDLRAFFDILDEEKTGSVDLMEIINCMKSMGFDRRNPALFKLLQEMYDEGTHELTFDVLSEMLACHFTEKTSADEMERVYKMFDYERNGEISQSDFRRVYQEMGEPYQESEATAILANADIDGDGKVTLEDFDIVVRNRPSVLVNPGTYTVSTAAVVTTTTTTTSAGGKGQSTIRSSSIRN